uniref:Uncharacterized protein n=1 Tax=Anguilla anguilla TaxID=7936 RepID=A0A0E9SD20_ANGAN
MQEVFIFIHLRENCFLEPHSLCISCCFYLSSKLQSPGGSVVSL